MIAAYKAVPGKPSMKMMDISRIIECTSVGDVVLTPAHRHTDGFLAWEFGGKKEYNIASQGTVISDNNGAMKDVLFAAKRPVRPSEKQAAIDIVRGDHLHVGRIVISKSGIASSWKIVIMKFDDVVMTEDDGEVSRFVIVDIRSPAVAPYTPFADVLAEISDTDVVKATDKFEAANTALMKKLKTMNVDRPFFANPWSFFVPSKVNNFDFVDEDWCSSIFETSRTLTGGAEWLEVVEKTMTKTRNNLRDDRRSIVAIQIFDLDTKSTIIVPVVNHDAAAFGKQEVVDITLGQGVAGEGIINDAEMARIYSVNPNIFETAEPWSLMTGIASEAVTRKKGKYHVALRIWKG